MIEYRRKPGTNLVELCTAGNVDDWTSKQILTQIELDMRKYGQLRILHEVRSRIGFSPAKFWNNIQVATAHNIQFSRVALVTDLDWLTNMTASAGIALTTEMRMFSRAQLTDARMWLESI
ncbi:MAG: STAS/SEC14 domain-containing protein [Phormidesmis sp. RL_2_1]|nr:STAS/SEC14 domain-containing protein [Phormidesmis sp. RL_2_1]